MQRPLIQFLSTWVGRQATQNAFEARGFRVHRTWQEREINFCGKEHAVEINRYWDEFAQETVCSAGKAAPNLRKFGVEPGYRSSYLDELAAKKDFVDSVITDAPLVRCLYEHLKRAFSDIEFCLNEASFFENLKEHEAKRFAISSKGWAERKRDAIPFARQFAEARGFVSKSRRFVKKTPSGIVFEFKVDLGGNPDCVGRIPLLFYIYHQKEPDFIFNIVIFDYIMPGLGKYTHCTTPPTYILGILTHIEFFDVLFHSFRDA